MRNPECTREARDGARLAFRLGSQAVIDRGSEKFRSAFVPAAPTRGKDQKRGGVRAPRYRQNEGSRMRQGIKEWLCLGERNGLRNLSSVHAFVLARLPA